MIVIIGFAATLILYALTDMELKELVGLMLFVVLMGLLFR